MTTETAERAEADAKAMADDAIASENDDYIAQMVADQAAPVPPANEPGTMQPGQVINRGDSENPIAAVATPIESAGWATMYDTLTGDTSLANKNMLPDYLTRRHPDDPKRRQYTLKDPGFRPRPGRHKCLLHAETPQREYYNSLGLAVCRKSNLQSPFQVIRHMRHRHQMEYQTIEHNREQEEKESNRKFQEAMLERMAGPAPASVPAPDAVAPEAPTGTVDAPLYESSNPKPPKAKTARKSKTPKK